MADNEKTETKRAARAPSARERADARIAERADAAQAREARLAEEAKLDEPAKLSPATDMEASGAIIEDGAVEAVDYAHPAVDNNPRAGTSVRQNAIDFNDPELTSEEAVEVNLEAQGGK